MALQQSFSLKGIQVTDAYWFLRQIVFREGVGLMVELVAYADASKRQESVNDNAIDYRNFQQIPYSKSGGEKMEVVAYNYIKTQSEFVSALSV